MQEMRFFSFSGKGGIRLGGRRCCNTSVVRLWQEALPLSWLCGDAQAPPAGLSALPKGPEMSPCVEPFLSAGNRWDEVPWRGVDGGGGGLF